MNRVLSLLSVLVLVGGCGVGVENEATLASSSQAVACDNCEFEVDTSALPHPQGAFTCDFELPGNLPAKAVPALTERDRMYMGARPGMLSKQLPLGFPTSEGGNVYSGGRYLFDTEKHAREYKDWVTNHYRLDGVPFFQRPYFFNVDCHSWEVIGSRTFADLRTHQAVVRTERWQLPDGRQHGALQSSWRQVEEAAIARGFTAVWLLYNREERLASVVYFGDHVMVDPNVPDFPALNAIAQGPALGELFSGRAGWTKIFDRSLFVWSVWFPFVAGDRGEPSAWPNSPPLPAPYAGDGLCLVSAGENHTNSPDCPATCGNMVVDAGESTTNCPGDVRDF